ncbi:hypothetical protein GTO89_01405 [Heliobacterium gestii]|uniref:Uncharacterized protein n=1 Tax=Heliomicrobium gestii TaxID=2699 RepID=A0A845L519_HELGE|nr:hypothetical protein [Heliomicrobium gestii]MBM7865432.1 hypothetical protein [Heliomicrobium gestii]MZP41687.1 hypothetical protein [Heliomicrobium gestii]
MANGINGDEWRRPALRARVRFDFHTPIRKNRLFFGAPDVDKEAEMIREQQVALLRNVPIQGITVEDIDMAIDIYILLDEATGREIAFAPVIVTVGADTLEDLLRFTLRDEYRKIELIEPEQFFLHRFELERFIFRINEDQKQYRQALERRLTPR